MNPQLEKALQELKDIGAEGVPSPDEVMNAADASTWSGAAEGGGHWQLVKHHNDSYTTHTAKEGEE